MEDSKKGGEMKYNLTRYNPGDRVILGRDEDGHPHVEGVIIEKLPKMVKVRFEEDNYYFGKPQSRWLSANQWWVVSKV